MKYLTLTLMFVAFNLGLMAQDQGQILMSGSTGLNFSSLSLNDTEPNDLPSGYESSTSRLDLDLTVGYFIIDGLAAGLSINSSSTTLKLEYNGDSDEDKTTITIIAPMIRYYIAETDLYGQLSYGLGSTVDKYTSGSSSNEDKMKVSSLGIGVGYSIFLSDDVAISPSLGYSMATSTIENGAYDSNGNTVDYVQKQGGIGFDLAISVFLGN
tara:strand:+ start:1032 stop:1664 length:633 start_codon:yes stop_codon:yes gene_type:complete